MVTTDVFAAAYTHLICRQWLAAGISQCESCGGLQYTWRYSKRCGRTWVKLDLLGWDRMNFWACLQVSILALPGPNSTTVLGPGKRACKIASRSLWPGFASANQLSVWNASPQLFVHEHFPFSSSAILKGRVQKSHSWRSQVKLIDQSDNE